MYLVFHKHNKIRNMTIETYWNLMIYLRSSGSPRRRIWPISSSSSTSAPTLFRCTEANYQASHSRAEVPPLPAAIGSRDGMHSATLLPLPHIVASSSASKPAPCRQRASHSTSDGAGGPLIQGIFVCYNNPHVVFDQNLEIGQRAASVSPHNLLAMLLGFFLWLRSIMVQLQTSPRYMFHESRCSPCFVDILLGITKLIASWTCCKIS
jgi:hypothetical protein